MPVAQSLTLGFIVGVGLAVWSSSLAGAFLLLLFSLSLLLSVLLKDGRLLIVSLCLVMAFLGLVRMRSAQLSLNRPEMERLFSKKVILEGEVKDLTKGLHGQSFILSDTQVKMGLTPEIKAGDKVRVKGVAEEPPVWEGFNYKEYLKRQGVYLTISHPQVEVLEKGSVSIPLFLKNKLRQGLEQLSLTEQGFFEALMFGDEENISKEWKDRLNASGTRHIAAVSGMNITILAGMVSAFFLSLGLWRRQAFWVTLTFIVIYVLMIGAPPSGVRAGIMGALVLLATQTGRLSNSEYLATLTLGGMLLFNPLLILDIGFQLSFLAFMGLVWLSPYLSRVLRRVPNVLQLRSNLASTLSAQVLALPILVYNFGRMSLVAPLSNIFVLPLLPFLTIAGFIFSFVSLIWPDLGWLLSLVPRVLLRFVMISIKMFSRLPWAEVELGLPVWLLVVTYIGIFLIVLRLKDV